MLLETFLPRKVSGSTTTTSSTASITPPMSRASSSSFSDSGNGSVSREGGGSVSLVPLTSSVVVSGGPSPLRLRSTAQSSSSSSPALNHDDESLSNSEDDESNKGSSSPSVLRSVLGASPFLMGPHIFSTSELGHPPQQRARKESCDQNDIQQDIDNNNKKKKGSTTTPPSSSNNTTTVYRRAAPQSSPLMASSSSSFHGSSFSDIDLESGCGEQQSTKNTPYCNKEEVTPLVLSPSAPPMLLATTKRKQQQQQQQPKSYQKNNYAFVLRSREQIIIHFLMEAKMLQTDLLLILFITFYQFFHSAVTNIAYYQHAQLNAANRVPLRDVAFDYLPPLDGELWIVSEYILCAILGISISCIVSNLVVKWNAPHGRPIYCMQIIRRMGMTWVVCQTLRMISFLVTTLPGASRQCRYAVPSGLTSEEMLNGPAPDEGNPSGWAPPTELNDILFRVDATNGCGDLMFSSHTIYTMTFVCVVFKYFNFKWLKLIMALGQIAIVPFILAARKHYSVDVFTALYVTPLVFEILWTRFPDRDTSVDLAKYYGIRFYLAQEGSDAFSYVVSIWGREFYIDADQLPVDVGQGSHHGKGLSVPWGKGGETSRSTIV